ncbi:MAG: hypothetical protein AAF960_26635, partial [Bacteroidota bacterium]
MRFSTVFFFYLLFNYCLLHGQASSDLSNGNDENYTAPNQLGSNGLIYTPSAYLNPWKTIDL